MQALGQVAGLGNQAVIEALAEQFEHSSAHVRGSAVQAIAQVAEKGDSAALAKLRTRLEDTGGFGHVQQEAKKALEELAGPPPLFRSVQARNPTRRANMFYNV